MRQEELTAGQGLPPASLAAEDESLARLFRALAGPGRLRLVELLLEQELTLEGCAAHLDRAANPASADEGLLAQLSDLVDCGCVTEIHTEGVSRYRADPRAAEVVSLARAFATYRFEPLNTCRYIRDESGPAGIGRTAGTGIGGRLHKEET